MNNFLYYYNIEFDTVFHHCFIITNPSYYVPLSDKIKKWLEENTTGDYGIRGSIIYFAIKSDAMLFKTVWE